MVTIHRAFGLRFVIFSNDHLPAHVHAIGDGEAKINIVGADGQPELIWAVGLKRNDIRRAMDIVAENQTAFLEKWTEIHGKLDG